MRPIRHSKHTFTNSKTIPVKVLDLAILLYHVQKGAQDQQVGFEDANESLDSFTNMLNRAVLLEERAVEGALWSANMMDEQGKFWHPDGLGFEDFLRSVFGKSDAYNRRYSLIKNKD